MRQLTCGSLFSGIGGFDLGFERAGIKTVWQVEIDPFCRKVLERHFPDAERFEDVRTVGSHNLKPVDIICGGFPCQDISYAGKGAGIEGERSGLWKEYARIIGELRPRFVVVENVSALLGRGLGRVCGDLAEVGYDAEWDCLPASAFGAEHERDRLFLVAYTVQPGFSVRGATTENGCDARIFGKGLGFAVGTPQSGLECRGAAAWRGDVHGIPRRVDRIRALGNAVVPQIPEWIGRRIVEATQ